MAVRLNGLQVFRGVAALLVVLFHTTSIIGRTEAPDFLGAFFAFGGRGVDAFFVLSGFIIYYTSCRTGFVPAELSTYLRKRLTRVYPIYWVVFFFVLIVELVVDPQSEELSAARLLSSFLLFPQENLPLLGVAWTLTHELLFYCVFGLLFLFPIRWAATLIGLWVSISAINFAGLALGIEWTAFSTPLLEVVFSAYNLEFMFGAGVAMLYLSGAWRLSRHAATILVALGASAFLVSGLLVQEWQIFDDKTASRVIQFGLPSALVVYGLVWLDAVRTNIYPRYLVLLGDSSYSLYLMHFPVVVVTVEVLEGVVKSSTLLGLIVVGMSVTAGLILHIAIERPLLRRMRPLSTDR